VALRQAALRSRDGRARILHVEDDDDVIEVVGAIVHDEADIVPARSLAEARARLAERRYDLVIIDVGLPDGSGLDLLETINARTPREPVLIFSAQDSNGSLRQRRLRLAGQEPHRQPAAAPHHHRADQRPDPGPQRGHRPWPMRP
jgi:CheY-like chemotaxis protein